MPKQPADLGPTLKLNHSALGGFLPPEVGPEAEAVQRAGGAVPEPLRPIDPNPAVASLKPGTKIE